MSNLNTQQVVALVTPLVIAAAGLGVHFLSAGQVSEVSAVLTVCFAVVSALRNVFVPAPAPQPSPPTPPGASGIVGFLIALSFGTLALAHQACTPQQAQDVQSAINAGLVIAGDTCKLVQTLTKDSEPQYAVVACTVAGVAAPVVATLPWVSWVTALQTVSKPDGGK